jgi:hypothetical protein
MVMDKRHLVGQNLGRVFNFRQGRTLAPCTSFFTEKLSNLKSKTWPKQVLGRQLRYLCEAKDFGNKQDKTR